MKKIAPTLLHLSYWILTGMFTPHFFTWPFIKVMIWTQHPVPSGPYHSVSYDTSLFSLLAFLVPGALVFYASYLTFPYFTKKPKRLLLLLAVYIAISLLISLPTELFSSTAAMLLLPIFYFQCSGLLLRICIEWLKSIRIKELLEKDKERSQLELLKAKIDTHFLFNNLNNIDVVLQESPEQASVYLKKMSDLLRYMLYDAVHERIALSKELEYIRSYVDLQKIRSANPDYVSLEMTGDPISLSISPMILIHFIENAFKHAANKKQTHAIQIKIVFDAEQLKLTVKNMSSAGKSLPSDHKSMGLNLLRQKMNLLYPGRHHLTISEENNWYLVHLDLTLLQ